MAATVQLCEMNGPVGAPAETVDIANVNMGSTDAAELNPLANPITAMADGHGYEKYLRLFVSDLGGSTQVDNIKIWLSNLGGGWLAGEGWSTSLDHTGGYVNTPYDDPVDTNSLDAVNVMYEAEPASANLGIGGLLAGVINAAPAYSDFCVLQLDVTALTPAGNVNQKTLTFQWDEM